MKKPKTITVQFNRKSGRFHRLRPGRRLSGQPIVRLYLGSDGHYYTVPENK